jgi:hypothetical protein
LQLKQQEQVIKLEEMQQAAQIQLMKMHTNATAAMHAQLMEKLNAELLGATLV